MTGVRDGVVPGRSVEVTTGVFRADRPFVWAIVDRQTRAILFLGRLLDPRS